MNLESTHWHMMYCMLLINLVNKQFQAKDLLIDAAIDKVQGLVSFFKGYKDTAF